MSETSEIQASIPEGLEGLAAELAKAELSQFTNTFFREICQNYSVTIAVQACLRCLGEETVPGVRQIGDWVAKSSAYVPILFNPEFLPLAAARRAAVVCRRHDARFLSRILQFLTESETPERIVLHGLSVLDVLEDGGTLVPLLRMLTRHKSERVRSSAAKVLCKVRPNRMLIERQLQSYDPRTRANAIEGLWGTKTAEAAEIFRLAALDAHHRVAVNALVGLYHQKDATAFDRLLEFARHKSPLYRMAAIWAFSQLGDPRAVPVLEVLAEDPRIFVGKRASAALAELEAKLAEGALPPAGTAA